MLADRTVQQNLVARPRAVRRKFHARSNNSDSRRIDKQSVGAAFLHDLRVSGNHGYPGAFGGSLQRLRQPAKGFERQSFFDDERGAQKERLGSSHGEIVDRAVNRERSDVTARKKQWLDDVGIGGECQSAAVDLNRSLIVETRENRVMERRKKNIVQQFRAELAAAPVTQ